MNAHSPVHNTARARPTYQQTLLGYMRCMVTLSCKIPIPNITVQYRYRPFPGINLFNSSHTFTMCEIDVVHVPRWERSHVGLWICNAFRHPHLLYWKSKEAKVFLLSNIAGIINSRAIAQSQAATPHSSTVHRRPKCMQSFPPRGVVYAE
jgi:hypothetical protein